MRTGFHGLVLFCCCLAVIAGPRALADDRATAEEPNPHLWQPRTKSVAVFKNGFGFFLREGEATLRDGWAVAKEIPPATFGTLAVYATNKDELIDIVGSGPGEMVEFDGRDAPKDVAAKRARLDAALKLKVQLSYKHQGKDQTAAGKLISIGPEFVVLDGEAANFAVPLEGITKMQLLETPLRIHVESEGDSPPTKTTIGLAYLREGITWIPEYTLKVIDETTAELTLRGTLVNEAEDLIHTDVNFVVGVPRFAHTKFLAPAAVGQVIRSVGAAVAPPGIGAQIANRSGIVSNYNQAPQFTPGSAIIEQPVTAEGGQLAEKLGNLPQLDAAGASDYTVYTKKDLTVRRGERAIVTLMVKRVPYSHVYRWEPPEGMQHFMVLQNNTDTAFTTGPCLATTADAALGEDLLKYTPRGGRCELPLTASVNVAQDKTEREVDRKFRAQQVSGNVYYDLVTLSGQLHLKNFEPKSIEVTITNHMPGKPVSASDAGNLVSDANKLQLADLAGCVQWTITLKPGETKVLDYKYERYVPSR